MKFWKKIGKKERQEHIQNAIDENVNFAQDSSLAYPA